MTTNQTTSIFLLVGLLLLTSCMSWKPVPTDKTQKGDVQAQLQKVETEIRYKFYYEDSYYVVMRPTAINEHGIFGKGKLKRNEVLTGKVDSVQVSRVTLVKKKRFDPLKTGFLFLAIGGFIGTVASSPGGEYSKPIKF